MSEWIYRVGLAPDEASEADLKRVGLVYDKVFPRERFLSAAESALGKPYKRGASVLRDAPYEFDCSSLVAWAAVEAGYSIPRISIDQFVYTKRIGKDSLQPGDLIFANTGRIIHTDGTYYSQVLEKDVAEVPIRTETLEYKPGTQVPEGVDHVGLYIGDDKVIHASYYNGVIEEKLSGSTAFKNIVGYGRIFDGDEFRYVVEIPPERPELRFKGALLDEFRKAQA